MTRDSDKTAETAAATPGDLYRQARDQVAGRAEYDLQGELERLTQWMLDDDPARGRSLRVRAANPVEDAEATVRDQPPPPEARDHVPTAGVYGYRGPTACAAAGITYLQLDYWARTGLVEPSVQAAQGSGSQRLYSFRDILVLKVVKRLLETGVSLSQIRAAIQHLRERGHADLAQVTLMSDGASVYECTSADEVVDLLQGGQGVFGIALGRVWREVEGSLAELPAELTADADPHGEPTYHRRGRPDLTDGMHRTG